LLDVSVDGQPMGSELTCTAAPTITIEARKLTFRPDQKPGNRQPNPGLSFRLMKTGGHVRTANFGVAILPTFDRQGRGGTLIVRIFELRLGRFHLAEIPVFLRSLCPEVRNPYFAMMPSPAAFLAWRMDGACEFRA
jgi:hypothetical protein